ncbi:hypothetical protein ACGFRB_25015 [Streptomyces sp. NPDC048718]|uniref:hypothetical protein n=1 Tax=Streptomyces sp. NPDC048718 TaxID=3365587 RepID=UPI003711BAE1
MRNGSAAAVAVAAAVATVLLPVAVRTSAPAAAVSRVAGSVTALAERVAPHTVPARAHDSGRILADMVHCC